MSSNAAEAPLGLAEEPSPRLLLAIAIAAGAAAVTSLILLLSSDGVTSPARQGVLYVWIILTYTAAGLVAWWRRPQSRFGAFLVATGLVTFLATLSFSDSQSLFTVGQLLDVVLVALVLHVLLAFPTGHLERSFERSLVAATYPWRSASRSSGWCSVTRTTCWQSRTPPMPHI